MNRDVRSSILAYATIFSIAEVACAAAIGFLKGRALWGPMLFCLGVGVSAFASAGSRAGRIAFAALAVMQLVACSLLILAFGLMSLVGLFGAGLPGWRAVVWMVALPGGMIGVLVCGLGVQAALAIAKADDAMIGQRRPFPRAQADPGSPGLDP